MSEDKGYTRINLGKLRASIEAKEGEHIHICWGDGCQGEWWHHQDPECQEPEKKECPLCDGYPNGDQGNQDQGDK
jgi:hypothetical protein